VQVRGFFIDEVIKKSVTIANPHLITSGISIYRKINYLGQAFAWLFQLQVGVGELVRLINKGNPQVRLRATQVSE
jgi:hypothetical protein